jgi:hypothetical protein
MVVIFGPIVHACLNIPRKYRNHRVQEPPRAGTTAWRKHRMQEPPRAGTTACRNHCVQEPPRAGTTACRNHRVQEPPRAGTTACRNHRVQEPPRAGTPVLPRTGTMYTLSLMQNTYCTVQYSVVGWVDFRRKFDFEWEYPWSMFIFT